MIFDPRSGDGCFFANETTALWNSSCRSLSFHGNGATQVDFLVRLDFGCTIFGILIFESWDSNSWKKSGIA